MYLSWSLRPLLRRPCQQLISQAAPWWKDGASEPGSKAKFRPSNLGIQSLGSKRAVDGKKEFWVWHGYTHTERHIFLWLFFLFSLGRFPEPVLRGLPLKGGEQSLCWPEKTRRASKPEAGSFVRSRPQGGFLSSAKESVRLPIEYS